MEFESYIERSNRESQRFLRRAYLKLKHFWWLVISCGLIGLVLAFLIIRYSPSIYSIGAKVLIENSSEGFDPTNFLFGDQMMRSNQEVVNELIILKSYPIVKRAVLDQNRNVHYYRTTTALERVIEIEPGSSPFIVEAVPGDEFERGLGFKENLLVVIGKNAYSIFLEGECLLQEMNWGDTVVLDDKPIIFHLRPDFEIENQEIEFFFRVDGVEETVQYYQQGIEVAIPEEKSSILSITLEASLPNKEVSFLETLLKNYLNANLDEKNQGASNTIDFINGELSVIKDSLKKIEFRLEAFKSRNQISNLNNEGQKIFEKLLKLEEERAEYQLIEKYLNLVNTYLEADDNTKLVNPSSFGISDESLNALTQDLLKLETERKLLGGQANSQIAAQLDARIMELRKGLKGYISNVSSTNRIRLDEVNRRMQLIEESIEGLPVSEMALMNIERLHNLSESLYLLLLEKRAEAEITRSSNTPDVQIVEPPRILQSHPVRPNKKRIYIVGILLGLILPIAILVLLAYGDKSIRTKEEITEELDVPFMGYIASSKDNQIDVVKKKPKSRLSETFRTLRSNLKYTLGTDGDLKIILVSSCFPGEGKTYVSANLAVSFASAVKKVVVIGADLRKPTLQNVFGVSNSKGLSNYLVGEIPLEDVILKTEGGPDIIVSGPIPPNPLELLDSGRFMNLLDELKAQYDNVIIDTSPLALVSDAVVLLRKTDINLIVLRSGISEHRNVDIIKDLVGSTSDCKFGIVLNDHDLSQDYSYRYPKGYGNGYGYYSDN